MLSQNKLSRAIVACSIAFVFFVVLLACSMSGCAARVKNVTDLPPGVTLKQAQDWDAAVADLHNIAASVSTTRKAVVDAHNVGAFPSDTAYVGTLQALSRIDQLELSAEDLLRQAPKNFAQPTKTKIADLMQKILTDIGQLNVAGVTGIKDSKSQAQVAQLITELTGIVNLVFALTAS